MSVVCFVSGGSATAPNAAGGKGDAKKPFVKVGRDSAWHSDRARKGREEGREKGAGGTREGGRNGMEEMGELGM